MFSAMIISDVMNHFMSQKTANNIPCWAPFLLPQLVIDTSSAECLLIAASSGNSAIKAHKTVGLIDIEISQMLPEDVVVVPGDASMNWLTTILGGHQRPIVASQRILFPPSEIGVPVPHHVQSTFRK